ncbi:MAG: hypothetical protein AAFZ65_19590 [Planctomycetota bacterium]
MQPPRESAPGAPPEPGLHRPLWKRVVLPLVGALLVVAGLVLWLTPVLPGGFLTYLGIPLLFAASPQTEARVRRWMRWRVLRLAVRWRRWRRRRQGL